MSSAGAESQSPWVLFGWDLSRIAGLFRLGMRQMLWDPIGGVRAKLESPIALHDADGSEPRVFSDAGPSDAPADTCAWHALRVPDELVLQRELSLPTVIESELESTIHLEVDANSPFPPEERLVGWRIVARDEDTLKVCIAITTRTEVSRFLSGPLPHAFDDAVQPELWCLSDVGVPIPLPGFGEEVRENAYRRSLMRIFGVCVVVAALAVAILAVPVMVSSLRAAKLENLLVDVQAEVREEMRLREELSAVNSSLDNLASLVVGAPQPRAALNLLAQHTPDSVYLNRVDFEESRLRISGFAEDAAEYMQVLSTQAWLDSVSSPSAFQRDPRSGRERFTLDAGLLLADDGATREQASAGSGGP